MSSKKYRFVRAIYKISKDGIIQNDTPFLYNNIFIRNGVTTRRIFRNDTPSLYKYYFIGVGYHFENVDDFRLIGLAYCVSNVTGHINEKG